MNSATKFCTTRGSPRMDLLIKFQLNWSSGFRDTLEQRNSQTDTQTHKTKRGFNCPWTQPSGKPQCGNKHCFKQWPDQVWIQLWSSLDFSASFCVLELVVQKLRFSFDFSSTSLQCPLSILNTEPLSIISPQRLSLVRWWWKDDLGGQKPTQEPSCVTFLGGAPVGANLGGTTA